jgi:hypothetical protein
MAILRHGGMGGLFAKAYAPSTLGWFLRAFTFGHIRQLDAVASRFLLALAKLSGVVAATSEPGNGEARRYALVDVDDTVIEVHGHAKQGAGFGYNRIRGLNAVLATLTTSAGASGPVIVAQRLRKGACNSSRGAKRLVGDATKTARRLLGRGHLILVRMDSALCRYRHNADQGYSSERTFTYADRPSGSWRGRHNGRTGARTVFSGTIATSVTPLQRGNNARAAGGHHDGHSGQMNTPDADYAEVLVMPMSTPDRLWRAVIEPLRSA